MTTIEEFFENVEEFYDKLGAKSSKTIHTDWYEETIRELYADWKEVEISLRPFVEQETIDTIDRQFGSLLQESRKSRSDRLESVSSLKQIEDLYIEFIYPEISHRDIESGFVNSLVTDLNTLQDEKYREYLNEAVQCIQAEAYRGAVVLGWQAAMYGLYIELESLDTPLHVAYQKKFGKTPDFKIENFWDFQKMRDHEILVLSEEVGLIDKSLKDMLEREKDTRNKAAHPGVYDVGPNGTKAVLETIIQLLIKLQK